MKKHTEIRFEEAIELYLTEHGYQKGDPEKYNNDRPNGCG